MINSAVPADFPPLLAAISAKAAKLSVNNYGNEKVLGALADLAQLSDALHAYMTNAEYLLGRLPYPDGMTERAALLRRTQAAKRLHALQSLFKKYRVKAPR